MKGMPIGHAINPRAGCWIAVFALALLTVRANAAPLDPVLFWNDQTNKAIQTTSMDPFMATRALALESIAVFDTVRSAADAPGFLVRLPAPAGILPDVAASAAAHAVLRYLFPERRSLLDALFARALTPYKAGPQRTQTVRFGESVAAAIIAIRDRDGWNRTGAVRGGTGPGQWRPTPPYFLPTARPTTSPSSLSNL